MFPSVLKRLMMDKSGKNNKGLTSGWGTPFSSLQIYRAAELQKAPKEGCAREQRVSCQPLFPASHFPLLSDTVFMGDSGVLKRPGLKRDTGVWNCPHEVEKIDGELHGLRPVSYSSYQKRL